MRTMQENRALAITAMVMTIVLAGQAAAWAQAQEGIKVIGDWSIVIRDEAGAVVQRSDFKNALQSQGKPTLARLLGRNRQIGDWIVLLTNGGPGTQPCGPAASGRSCGLVERLSPQLPFTTDTDYAPALTVGIDSVDPSRMRLQGSMKATGTGTITTVSTMLSVCPAGPVSPAGCVDTQTFAYFSGTQVFTNPPTVVQGQTIDVTVTFSFQ